MHDDLGRTGRGALQPEPAKRRKLLLFGQTGVDRHAARRDTVALAPTERAEIAGAKEDCKLVEVVGPIERDVQPQPGEAELLGKIGLEAVLAQVEQLRCVKHLACHAVRHLIDMHRRFEVVSEVKELGFSV